MQLQHAHTGLPLQSTAETPFLKLFVFFSLLLVLLIMFLAQVGTFLTDANLQPSRPNLVHCQRADSFLSTHATFYAFVNASQSYVPLPIEYASSLNFFFIEQPCSAIDFGLVAEKSRTNPFNNE